MSISGHTCLPYRDVTNLRGDTLAQRYEQTMERLQRIRVAGYTMEVVWECQFDKEIMPRYPEMKHHPILQHAPLNTRDVLYGGRTEAMVLHYTKRDGKTIEYYDEMSLDPYVCKYSMFPVGTLQFMCVTRVAIQGHVEQGGYHKMHRPTSQEPLPFSPAVPLQ